MLYLTSVSTTAEPAALDALLRQISRGNRAALEKLYSETKGSVYGYALSVLKNSHDAEDVLHDCYLSIVKGAAGYKSHGKPMAWILTLTRNLCLQKLREYQKADTLPPEDWVLLPDTREGITAEDKIVLAGCMKQLSDEERQIVVLHAVSGFKHREIAKLLELPLSTVLSKYSRALKKMKEILEKERDE